jgi:hypothetical protein
MQERCRQLHDEQYHSKETPCIVRLMHGVRVGSALSRAFYTYVLILGAKCHFLVSRRPITKIGSSNTPLSQTCNFGLWTDPE